MKGYFNEEEKIRHLMLAVAREAAKDFLERDCVTDEEKCELRKMVKAVDSFDKCVFERQGQGYRRNMINRLKNNTMRLCSKYADNERYVIIDTIEEDVLHEIIDNNADFSCEGCNRTDCKECGIFSMKSYLNYGGKNENNDLCPYRKEVKDFDFDFGE